MSTVSVTPCGRPLLKWAGGKRQLLTVLRRFYPGEFRGYLEPFFGSGAVFFDLYASGRLADRPTLLADVNADLIGCYRTVRDEADEVIRHLEALDAEHRSRGDACYYDVRDRKFNPARAVLSGAAAARYTPALAAMLIYLNRTGYNGLFRQNRRGEFNVPVGRYANPRICDPDHIRTVAAALGSRRVRLECQPFERTLAAARARDFVYCDPPYAPVSVTARFAQYTAEGFGATEQTQLQRTVVAAAGRGATVVLSNSSAPEIEEAYASPRARRAGLLMLRVPAKRAINSRAAARGPIDELIVTNAAAPSGQLRMAGADVASAIRRRPGLARGSRAS